MKSKRPKKPKKVDAVPDKEEQFRKDAEIEQNNRPPDAPEEKEKSTIDIQFPANILILAERYSGKSSIILSILSLYDFDHVFVISLTAENKTFEKVADAVIPGCSEKFLQDLIEEHRKKPNMKTCIIFDDFVGVESSGWNPKSSPSVNEISTSGRHKNITLIFSSQDWISIPIVFRRTSEYIFLGANKEVENERVSKFLAMGSMTSKKLLDIINDISGENNKQFLLLDRKKKSWHEVEAFIHS